MRAPAKPFAVNSAIAPASTISRVRAASRPRGLAPLAVVGSVVVTRRTLTCETPVSSIRFSAEENRMHAIVIRRHGDPDVLEPAEIARPEAAAGEALVRVEAVSVNAFLDVSNRAGKVPFARYDFPHVLGSEHAGTVAGYGPGTVGPAPVGAPVVIRNTVFCGHCDMCTAGSSEACRTLGIIGVTRPGAYAEYTTVPVANLRPLPPGCRPIDAAAMAVNGPLGYAQLRAAGLEATRTVLIQGAGSSSGSMAAIVAKALGKVVLGTTRGD